MVSRCLKVGPTWVINLPLSLVFSFIYQVNKDVLSLKFSLQRSWGPTYRSPGGPTLLRNLDSTGWTKKCRPTVHLPKGV